MYQYRHAVRALLAGAVWLAAACRPARHEAGDTERARRPLANWRAGATCYEIFVRSYRDSDGDGIGDLRGLIDKLDYINDGDPRTTSDLGARCIWLMPVAESPSYHGYDVADYYRVDREYGTNADFERMVAEAHRRGIAVLVDMVLNHLSSEHPHFRDALGGPGSTYRDWFRWSPAKPSQPGPWGQEAWHKSPVRDEYYYGVFWHGMPDLNYATPAVREEAKRIATFWLREMGVDGFRLDAVPYLVEEGSQLIGTPGTHAFLREYARHVRSVAPDAFTVGEVWDGIERMLPYYPDQLESYFAFDLSDAIVAAVKTGAAKPLLERYARFQAEVPAGRYSTFVRNHDQTRTATAVAGDLPTGAPMTVARARAAASLLLTLPGLPFVYYGEEIGMTGDKPDELLRTPMQWTADAGGGFTTAAPWQPLRPDWRTTNVAAQDADSTSLLSLHRRLIRLRLDHPALRDGTLAPLDATDPRVVAYVRRTDDRAVLVVANVGEAPLNGVALSSAAGALAPGRYLAKRLLGAGTDSAAATVFVGRTGQIDRGVLVSPLAPMQVHLFDLQR